jgi:hypothetical protein
MANNRVDPVSYRKFDPDPQLATGLLDVARDNGDLQRRVAMGMAAMADEFGRRADAEAQRAGERAGQAAALANPANASAIEGEQTGTASVNGQAGHVRGAVGGIVRVHLPPPEIRKVINDAAARHGVDPQTMIDIAGVESGFNPNAANRESSAGGLFQFIDSTAAEYGLKNKFDPVQASDAAARLVKANAAGLEKTLGRKPTSGEIYLAHQQGLGGALKILKNPDANAAALLGNESVLKNGGTLQMTAREFANRWTGKFSGGSANMVARKANAPVQVTPVLPTAEHQAQGFRPSGRDTIYGRAYNVAGTQTYLQQLKLTLIQDQSAVYDRYKDDPAMLQKALGELEQAHLREHVFPEIAADYKLDFGARALSLVQQAKAAQEIRVKAQDKADFFTRSGVLEDEKSRALVALRPDDVTSVARLHDLQNSVDAHYDAAVARGILDPMDAAEYKGKSRGEMTVGFYMKQAEGKNADEIRTMRADMATDYGKGELPDIRGEDWEQIDRGLAAAEQTRRTQDRQASASLRERGKTLVERHASGLGAAPDELNRFQLDGATAPDGAAIVQSTLAQLRVADALRTRNVHDVEKNLDTFLARPDGTVDSEDRQFSRDLIARHKAALAADPLAVAEKFGVVKTLEPMPVDGSADPETAAALFRQRMATAEAVAEHFGVPARYFRPEEVTQIDKLVKTQPEKALALAGGLVRAAGRNAPGILRELGESAPAMADAGDIISSSGNARAALDLLSGYGQTPEGKPYPDIPNTKRKASVKTVTGSSLMFDPEAQTGLDSAAAAIARKRLYDLGIDPKSEDAPEIYEQAVQEAAGATFAGRTQFGGFTDFDPGFGWSSGRVHVPPAMRADKFAEVIDALEDRDLGELVAANGKKWNASDFQRAMPVAVNGGYAFSLNDPSSDEPLFIASKDGKPIVLDINGMKDRLGPRVPGAWR